MYLYVLHTSIHNTTLPFFFFIGRYVPPILIYKENGEMSSNPIFKARWTQLETWRVGVMMAYIQDEETQVC